MSKPKVGIAHRLKAANVAIGNAIADAEIGALLASRGYGPAQLSEGQKLYQAAEASVKVQLAAEGRQKTAAQSAKAAEKAAHKAFQELAKTARAHFMRDKAALAVLGLRGPMPDTQSLFITMATALFDNVPQEPAIAEALKGKGYPPDKLAKERAKIDAMSAAIQAHQAAIGASQQATEEQTAALDALAAWMSEFIPIARLALAEKPQLLEALGILHRNAKTPAQRKAPAKAAATKKAKKEIKKPG